MEIVITTISIFAITSIVYLLQNFLPFKVCAICAGVLGTWLWMLIGILTNQLSVVSYQLLVGILMGGSVVGIAYQLEKRPALAKASAGKLFLWKTLFIPTGFVAVYGLITFSWLVFLTAGAILILLAAVFLRRTPAPGEETSATVKELEKEMENCC